MMVARGALPPGCDRLVVVASDIEMGAGGLQDDCPHSPQIADLLLRYRQTHPGIPIDLVFNGDTFDFLKTKVDGAYPRYMSEAVALDKLRSIAGAHGAFFDAVGRLAQDGCSVSFVVGNHDLELVFPAVQAKIRRRCGADIAFPGLRFERGNVLVEHGSQGDPMFRVDEGDVFVEHEGQTILNLPWGAVGLLDAVLPYHDTLYLLDRVRPKRALFEVLPEARDLLVQVARRYWLRHYWHDLLVERDPLKQLSWQILKEVAYRMVAGDADVSFGRHYVETLEADAAHDLIVVGHEHVAREMRRSSKTLLATSCLRSEYVIDPATAALSPSPKHIAEVCMRDGRAVDARLVPVRLPCGDPGDVRSLKPALVECLDALPPAPDLLPALLMAVSRRRVSRGSSKGRSFFDLTP